jgi:dienelactone hydrolase
MNFFIKCLSSIFIGLGSTIVLAAGMADPIQPDPALNESIVKIDIPQRFFSQTIQTTIFKPNGDGPFPIFIFNHGHNPGSLKFGHWQERERAILLTHELLNRGYVVVLPMRRGYGDSGPGTPTSFDKQQEDIFPVIDYLKSVKYVDMDRIVIGGVSLGGAVSMALGTQKEKIPGLQGVINVAGGFPSDSGYSFEKQLSELSSSKNVQSLWIYGDNDYLTPPEHLDRLIKAYSIDKPNFRVARLGVFQDSDAHYVLYRPTAVKLWMPQIDTFLSDLKLPNKVIAKSPWRMSASSTPPESGFAPLVNSKNSIISINKQREEGYLKYLQSDYDAKAFAVSTVNGTWSYAAGVEFAADIALKRCVDRGGITCKLYAINDKVVW